jgi:hypothetical protein
MLQDLRVAVRLLAKNSTFTAAVYLTLAIGIGGTTAMLTVVDAVLLRPLPFPQPDRLVYGAGESSRRATGRRSPPRISRERPPRALRAGRLGAFGVNHTSGTKH